MSSRELERVEVMGRVASRGLKLVDAASMLELSYRQVKRLWRRYQEVGRKGLQHKNAGRSLSNRSKPRKFRRQVLALIKKDENLKIIPTIILTTSDDQADVQISYQLQANCYLRKPAQWDAFDGLVRSINAFWLTRAKLPQPKSSARG